MKKIMLLAITLSSLFFITQTNAGCLWEGECPTEKVQCPKGEFMGDDGKCYSCDIDKNIGVYCLGFKELEKICPNRVFGVCGSSYLNCPSNYELVGKNCQRKCPAGYVKSKQPKELGYRFAIMCCKDDVCLFED